jgi:transporter family-2 protein
VNSFYIVTAVLTGAGIAAQALINSRLRTVLGAPLWAAVAQFVVGLVLLVVLAMITRPPSPTFEPVPKSPWWIWTGGVFGAAFIVVTIVLTPRMGTALTVASITVGQLVAALVFDHTGWLGAPVIRMSPARLAGAVLLCAGLALLRWR